MTINDCYFLGKITKKHGLKGEVVLFLDTDEPSLYSNMESFLIEKNGELIPFFVIESKWNSKGNLIVLLEDIDNNTSDSLIGLNIYLPLSTLPVLTGTKFYYHEVKGFSIINQENRNLGVIDYVNDQTSQHLFSVVTPEHKEFFIPIIEDWIIEINRDEKFITMNLPQGIEEV